MIRIDHLVRDDYAYNSLLGDLVIDLDDEVGVSSVARKLEFFRLFHTLDGQCSPS